MTEIDLGGRHFAAAKEQIVDTANSNGRRQLRITPGNIRNNHIYVRDHYDFFPDCVGPSRQTKSFDVHDIELVLDGLNEVVKTDIGANPKNGRICLD